jgi:tetratricopeptide (TPR) repeat protein
VQFGADHPNTILSRDSLATLYRSSGRFDLSIPLLEETIALRQAQFAPDDPETLGRQVTLGVNYCDAGKFTEGLALIEEVRQRGCDNPHPAWVRSILLSAYLKAGRSKGVLGLVLERVQDARHEFPEGGSELAIALTNNGELLLDAKAYAAAEALFRESLAIHKNAPDNPELRRTRLLLGKAIIAQWEHAKLAALALSGSEGLRCFGAFVGSGLREFSFSEAIVRQIGLDRASHVDASNAPR